MGKFGDYIPWDQNDALLAFEDREELIDEVDRLRAENEKLRSVLEKQRTPPEYDYRVKLDSWGGQWYQEIGPREPHP